MSVPLRNLPLIQNWSCHGCGDCCRIEAAISDEEKQRIEALDLANDPEVGAKPWFTSGGWGSRKWTLAHRPDGSCVFLTTGNRCRLQERFGAHVKPFACRLFPFVLIPAGDHWRVGMRFSCPSVAANRGQPMVDSAKDVAKLSRLLEQHVGRSADSAPTPLLDTGRELSWPDVCRLVQVLVEIVQDRGDRLERRLRKCLALARICGETRVEGLSGEQLTECLQLLRVGVDMEVPREAADLPPPSRLGRVLFRTLLAIFARRDRGMHRASGIWRRLGRVRAGWRFVRGRGCVPRVNEFLAATSFAEVERCSPMLPEIDETLERYYVVKLNSLQFFGPPNFDLPFWAGLDSLILTMPMILWLRRAIAGLSGVQAVQQAIELVDDHFAGNPLLGMPHIHFLQRTLAQRGELEKLVAWYGR